MMPSARSLALLLTALLCAGCSRASPFRSMERSIRAELPRLVGPADRYEVSMSRSTAGLIAGRIPWIEIQGVDVRAVAGLNLDELSIRLEGVRFNRADRTVRAIEQSRFQARIAAGSIQRFIRARTPALRDVWVRITQGQVRVGFSRPLFGLGVPIEVDGRPVLRGGSRIDFEANRVSVLHLGVPEFIVRRVEARVNPLVDLAALSFPVRLSAVRIDRDRVVLDGAALLTPAQLKQ